jgi:hypothetical protein
LARALTIITLHEVLTLVNGDCDETEDSALGKKAHRNKGGRDMWSRIHCHHLLPAFVRSVAVRDLFVWAITLTVWSSMVLSTYKRLPLRNGLSPSRRAFPR